MMGFNGFIATSNVFTVHKDIGDRLLARLLQQSILDIGSILYK